MKVFGIEFAPLCLPIRRRKETLAAFAWINLMIFGGLAGIFFVTWGILFSPIFRYPCLLYLVWQYYDMSSLENGVRWTEWARSWSWWRHFANYFPVKIAKTAELPPDRSYLFITCPHGVLSAGAFAAFCTDGCGFSKIFPGLKSYTNTIKYNMSVPFARDLSLALGGALPSEKCLTRILSSKGNSVCLVVGGAEEAYLSKPGQYKTIIGRRKGFVRIAYKTGASLVPTVMFGEPDVYDQIQCPPGSFLRWTQDAYKKLTGIAPVYLVGRGIFQYTYGMVPFRVPINIVTGRPIEVPKLESPTKQQIDELHQLFCDQLQELFDREKVKYLKNPTSVQLEFV